MERAYIEVTIEKKKNIALIAHDSKKSELVKWCMDNGYGGKVTYAAPTVAKSDITSLLKAGTAIDGAELVTRMNMGVK